MNCSKNYLDFGRGFYLTTYREQAEKWAKRKSMRYEKNAVVNKYELNENCSDFFVRKFDSADEDWLDYVCSCRKSEEIYKSYDIVFGRVANDDVFKTVDMYFRGLWDKAKALEELVYYKENDQICIINQKVIDSQLTFIESYEVNEDGK